MPSCQEFLAIATEDGGIIGRAIRQEVEQIKCANYLMFGVSAGIGTSALAASAGCAIAIHTDTDPMVGVLAGSVSAIAICAIASAIFFREKNG